jgi:beta-N-acetylhexosaminidase
LLHSIELLKSFEQLAGRLVIGRLPGLVLDDAHKKALGDGTLGGITLFKENAADLEQLVKLTSDIIKAGDNLVLTVDQEGGAVQRFDHVLSPLPSPMALAARHNDDSSEIETITAISARQLKALGFNLLLAPTLDLLTNQYNPVICTRAFSDDLDTVTAMGDKVITAIESNGLIACPKHYPGHGSTSQDSHLELAVVDKSAAELSAYDLVPFARNIEKMQAILVGHIWLPQIEAKENPATLSPYVVTDLLRHQLKFTGLAVSDDMTMKAITKAHGLGEACVLAIEAGIDLLLVCGTFAESQEAVQAIATAIKSGRLTVERIEQSIARLDRLFKSTGQSGTGNDSADRQQLQSLASMIAQDNEVSTRFSTTSSALLKGSLANCTIDSDWVVLAPAHPRYKLPLAQYLHSSSDKRITVKEQRYSLDPDQGEIEKLAAELSGKSVIYVTFRSFINQGQIALGAKLKNFVHVAADTPYDLLRMPEELIASLASFDPSDQAMYGVCEILLGHTKASGRSPVKLDKII